jgi:hypothetical protein
MHLTENKQVTKIAAILGARKKKRQEIRVYPHKLLKTHVEKMSAFGLTMMLMKTKELQVSYHDVHENKGC